MRAVVVALFVLASPVKAVAEPTEGRIIFVSDRDGQSDVYMMNADGSNTTRVTYSTLVDQDPDWSPDGSKIALGSISPDHPCLNNAPVPCWGYYDIYVMNADGSNPVQLAEGDEPAWSPDGSRIAFSTARGFVNEIFTMNADGSEQTRVTNNAYWDFDPDWSPDGSQFALWALQDTPNSFPAGIAVINADGSNPVHLADGQDPSWSPDGSRIAFSSYRDGTTRSM